MVTALTYEIHTEKEDFDLTPGQNLTWNWGISQFLPLRKDQTLLLEAGVTGYSSWQITDDSGSDPRNTGVRDQVHAVGAAGPDLRAVGRLTERALLWRVRSPGPVPGAGVRLQCGQEVLATPATRAQEENIECLKYRGAP